MAEILFYKIINNEIDLDQFLEWLVNYQSNDVTFNEFKCNQADFITYFLNLIHQDIPNFCSKWKQEVNRNNFKQINLDDSPNKTVEINKSYSFPMDLTNNSCSGSNSELMVAKAASTPKMSKFDSDTIINGSYMSPISPLYQPNTTKQSHRNNHEKSPICLGDFIIDKRFSSSSIKKKSRFNNNSNNNNDNSTKQRRIKPTNLTEKLNSSEKYEGSFNFLQNNCDDNIEILKNQEKLIQKSTIIKLNQNVSEIEPKLNRINYRKQLDCLVKIYITLINNSFILNLINEIHFLITLLVKKQYNCNYVDNDGELLQITELQQLFETIHNLIYFVTKILESQFEVFAVNFDRFTLKLLIENQRLVEFTPKFVRKLMKIYEKKEQLSIITTTITTTDMVVCFNIDTDNRENFPNDLSFHSFRKQRDLFYEILQIWDLQHLNNEWNFFMSLTGKIRTLFNLCQNESMNYLHMARLFKLQLLNCCICNNNQQQQLNDVVGNLSIDVEKLNRLKQRLTTKDSLLLSTSSLTTFNGREEFFKDFILAANNLYFNRYLCDTLICEIVELNETNFNFTDLGGDVKEIQLDLSTKKSYFTCIKSLRLLAKFLGFIESLPYQIDGNCLTQNLIGQHLKVRGQVQPNFDIKTILEESIHRKTLILCIPWLTIYLSMLDYITLRLPYYQIIGKILFEIYQNFNYFESKKNYYLIKFCLGYLFELQQYPIDEYYNYLFYDKKLITTPITTDNNDDNNMITIDNLDIIDQNLLYQCCPNLNNIKQLLSTTITNQETEITIKHVTPVTTLDTIDEMNRKRLQQQLEEAFLNGQPISIRKTIEFISERIASICVKYIVNIIIPKYKDDYQKNYQQFIIDNNLNQLQQQQQQLLIDNYKMKQIKQLQQQCYEEIVELSTNKIKISIDTLISFDILQQTKDVCCNITKRTCLERVKQWITSHITISAIFAKDTDNNDNIDNGGDNKKRNKPLFVLPPEGNNNKHNDGTISAAHLLEQLWDLSIIIIENVDKITDNDLIKLLDDILISIKERGDINECILATMCTMLVDLALLLLAHKSESLLNPLILEKLYEIWQLYYLGTNELFKTLLSVRNVNLLAQSKHVDLAWLDFAKFSLFLIRKQLLNCEQFEQQCTGLFRTDWNQQTLRLLTNYLKEFVRLYRDTGGNADDFMFLLDFLSDYCEDL